MRATLPGLEDVKNLPQEENYHFLIPSLGSPYPARNIVSESQENDNCLEESLIAQRYTMYCITWRRYKSWCRKAQNIGERRRERGRYIDRTMARLITMAYYIIATLFEKLPSCEWTVALKRQETSLRNRERNLLKKLGRIPHSFACWADWGEVESEPTFKPWGLDSLPPTTAAAGLKRKPGPDSCSVSGRRNCAQLGCQGGNHKKFASCGNWFPSHPSHPSLSH